MLITILILLFKQNETSKLLTLVCVLVLFVVDYYCKFDLYSWWVIVL